MGNADSVWLNGRIVDQAEGAVPPNDRGFLYGDGFFETTRILNGRATFLDRHLARLARSCRAAEFSTEIDVAALTDGVRELIDRNGVRDGYMRVTVSRGALSGALTALATEDPTILIDARRMELAPVDKAPAIVLARSVWRRNERSPLVGHKCLSYMENVLALAEARGRGADEVYFLNSRDLLAEGAITNLFWVKDGTVHTAAVDCGLLPGITRGIVLALCTELGIPAEEGEYAEIRLLNADEAFCTNSLRGVIPVRGFLEHPDVLERDGAVTGRLRQAYADQARAGGEV